MRYIHPNRWSATLVGAVLAGALVGAITLPSTGGQLVKSPAVLTLVPVNLVLPIGSLLLGFMYPRVRVALTGVLLLFGSFWVARVMGQEPRLWLWRPVDLARWTHPIFLLAMFLSLLAGVFGCGLAHAMGRRVGLPDWKERCCHCGYLITGLPTSICPECGGRISGATGEK